MRALAVFHDHGNHILDPLLKPGFRHCFAAVASEDVWIRIDAQAGQPVIEVVAAADYDLTSFYRAEGYTVVQTEQRSTLPAWPLVVTNCVGFVKTVLCINAPLAVTPWRLYRHLIRPRGAWLPGKSLFSPPKPKAPVIAAAPAPPPERRDPIIVGAGENQRQAELNRRGRRATILTTGAGVTSAAPLGRPAATLGG